MKQKHAFPTLFIFSLAFALLCACSYNKPTKIAFLYPSDQKERYENEGWFFSEKLKEHGAEALLIETGFEDNKQMYIGKELIKEDIDLLVIVPANENALAPLVRECNNHNIPVIAFNNLIKNSRVDLFISDDHIESARQLVKAALQKKPKGNYVILSGDRFDGTSTEQQKAINCLLQSHIENQEINIVYQSCIENWSASEAAYEIEQVLNGYGKQIDAIITGNDAMAASVIKVLKKHNLEKGITVIGQNGNIDGIRNIHAGLQEATIFHPHKKIGELIAKHAIALTSGIDTCIIRETIYNGLTDVPTIKIKCMGITKDNINKVAYKDNLPQEQKAIFANAGL